MIFSLKMPVCLTVLLTFSASAWAQTSQFTPKQSLQTLIPNTAKWIAIDGAVPVRLKLPVNAPEQAGWHWLALSENSDGSDLQLIRFQVSGDDTASTLFAHSLNRDLVPPRAELLPSNTVSHNGKLVLSRKSGWTLAISDPAKLDKHSVRLDGNAIELPAWDNNISSGEHVLEVHTTDKLGNSGVAASVAFSIDADGPEVSWTLPEISPNVPAGLTNKRSNTVSLQAHDDYSGVALLDVHDSLGKSWSSTGDSMQIKTRGISIHWRATDGLGNISSGVIPIRRDRLAPRLAVLVDGERRWDKNVRVSRDSYVELSAEDDGAGVENACLQLDDGECKTLPFQLNTEQLGNYKIRLKATDKLGNSKNNKITLEVVP